MLPTDFFGFDAFDDHHGLQGLGGVSQMGDTVLGRLANDKPPAKAS